MLRPGLVALLGDRRDCVLRQARGRIREVLLMIKDKIDAFIWGIVCGETIAIILFLWTYVLS